jgi:cyclohexanone monooxygenase
MSQDAAADALPFDPDALRERYRRERDKRLRADGNEQYRNVTGELARFVDDPYVEPGFAREPLTDEVDVLVVGGGFGGLLMGARLRDAGIEDLRIVEKAGDFGGTWYWNRYPGAQCDIESYIYLPLLEEIGYVPQEKYSHAPEILAHAQAIGRKYGLYDATCFQTEVTALHWDEEARRWTVHTNRDDRMRARFVCMANGPLHRPKLPGIPGVERFAGHAFHTSRWDYDYTGGGPDGGLVKLADERVGIIGTGATAVQCVPHLGEHARHLYVFQRTPSSIDVRGNAPTDPDWAASLGEGWHRHRMENFNTLVSGGFAPEDLVNDGWTDIIRKLLFRAKQGELELTPEGIAKSAEIADFEKMEEIRARVDAIVEDPATAEALKPWYRQFCKRPCFHDDYLPTFNRPNVTLVDTDGRGVEKIVPEGVVVDGTLYELDCLIFATGFEVGTDYTRRAGYEIHGTGGVKLTDRWRDGVATMHGIFSHGFPNCFLIQNAQAGFTANFPHLLAEVSTHIAHVLRQALDAGATRVEATQEAEDAWVARVLEKAGVGMDFLESCTPGYYNNEGKLGERAIQNGFYGGGPVEYFAILKAWREAGGLEGLAIEGDPTRGAASRGPR